MFWVGWILASSAYLFPKTTRRKFDLSLMRNDKRIFYRRLGFALIAFGGYLVIGYLVLSSGILGNRQPNPLNLLFAGVLIASGSASLIYSRKQSRRDTEKNSVVEGVNSLSPAP
jgi:hypothetical protein